MREWISVVFVVFVVGCQSEEQSVCIGGQVREGCPLALCGKLTTGQQMCIDGQWGRCYPDDHETWRSCPEPMVFRGSLCRCPEEEPAVVIEGRPVAQLTCTPPDDGGTIICHIGVQTALDGGKYDCHVDQSTCYEGAAKTLRPGQSCEGAVVCTLAVPRQ